MDKTFALYATGLYILTTSPATASSPYTEPLFAFLTCTGLWLILPSRISKTSGAELVISKVLGLLCLAGATATRSLGILNVIIVIWQGFLQPVYQGDRRVSVRPIRANYNVVDPPPACSEARHLDSSRGNRHHTAFHRLPIHRLCNLLLRSQDSALV
jgi:hypothetical protein